MARCRMKLGLVAPLIEGSLNDREGLPDGITPRFRDVQAMAQAAESLGLDSLWLTAGG
jgi:hypothetical protein